MMEKRKKIVSIATIAFSLWLLPDAIRAQETGQQENPFAEDTNQVVVVDQVPDIEPQRLVPSDLLKSRFSKLEKQIPLVYHEVSHQFVEYFIYKKPEFTRRMLEKRNLYFPLYEKSLAKHGLPDELKYLSMIESGLDPRIISYAGAGGLWQFMRATGREFGLMQNAYVDERFDPAKATDAACRYLKQLYTIFGDWELALASYNAGPGSVKRAMRRSGGDTFWTVYNALPKQTRNYVPQFVAMIYMMNFAKDHGINVDQPEYPIAFDTIQIDGYMNLQTFASLSGVTMEDIKLLNPQIINKVLPDNTRNFILKLPSTKYSEFVPNLAAIRDSSSKRANGGLLLADGGEAEYSTRKIYHKVRSGETLASVARKYGVSVNELKRTNGLRRNGLKKGQSLAIVRRVKLPDAVEPATETVLAKNSGSAKQDPLLEKFRQKELEKAANAISATEPVPATLAAQADAAGESAGKSVTESSSKSGLSRSVYVVKQGESLYAIAQKHGISAVEIFSWNNLKSDQLKPGQELQIVKAEPSSENGSVKGLYSRSKVSKETAVAEADSKSAAPATHHIVRKGETLFAIAKTYNVTVGELKEWNEMGRDNVRMGQKLLVRNTAVTIASNDRPETVAPQPGRTKITKPKFHTVQRGDTLWTISQRYGLSVDVLKKNNKIKGNSIKAGMKLNVTS